MAMECHPYKVFTNKMHVHPTLLHPLVIVGPFTKWGVDFTKYKLAFIDGHKHIIMVIDYFTKWEALINDRMNISLFIFNHVISKFGVPCEIFIDHRTYF